MNATEKPQLKYLNFFEVSQASSPTNNEFLLNMVAQPLLQMIILDLGPYNTIRKRVWNHNPPNNLGAVGWPESQNVIKKSLSRHRGLSVIEEESIGAVTVYYEARLGGFWGQWSQGKCCHMVTFPSSSPLFTLNNFPLALASPCRTSQKASLLLEPWACPSLALFIWTGWVIHPSQSPQLSHMILGNGFSQAHPAFRALAG